MSDLVGELRVLTVRQPWAWAIIHGGKDVENRVRNIAGSYRGPVAIHAGLKDDDDWDETIAAAFIGDCPHRYEWQHNTFTCTWCTIVKPQTWKHHGHILGIVDLVDVHAGWVEGEQCSVWGERYAEHDGCWHLALANPRPLDAPVKFTGGQGLRWLPDDVAAQVWAGVTS